MPYRTLLEGLLERTRRPEKRAEYEAELRSPPFPEALRYLWRAYQRLRRRKGGGMAGPVPLEWPDIEAFNRLSGLRLAPWEIEIVEELDDLFLLSRVNRTDTETENG